MPDGRLAGAAPMKYLLSPELAQLLGYAPRVDVLLEREDGGRRLWIEFEISRADPVANHARFATAQLFEPRHSYHQNSE